MNTLRITKRQRFIIASAVSSILVIFFPFLLKSYGNIVLPLSIIITYITTYFALKEDISGIEYVTLFVLPIAFLLGTGLFISVLPERKLYRWPIFALFPIGMYTIYLTLNIINVAAIRTIQLLRFAKVWSYILTIMCGLFLTSYILSLRLPLIPNTIAITIVMVLLTMQFLWSLELTPNFGRKNTIYTLIIALAFAQIAIVVHFYALITAMAALLLVSVQYVLLGIIQHYYEKKLTRRVAVEYFAAATIIFFFVMFSLNFGI